MFCVTSVTQRGVARGRDRDVVCVRLSAVTGRDLGLLLVVVGKIWVVDVLLGKGCWEDWTFVIISWGLLDVCVGFSAVAAC